MARYVVSSARRKGRPARWRRVSLGSAMRWCGVAILLLLLAYGMFLAARAILFNPNVSSGLAKAVILLAVGIVGIIVLRLWLGRIPVWAVVVLIGFAVFTFLLGAADLAGFMGSEQGRKIAVRLEKVLPGEELTLSARDLTRVSSFRTEIEGFLDVHQRIRRVYHDAVTEVVAAKGGRLGPVIQEAALADPMARVRIISILKKIRQRTEEATNRLLGIEREVHRRYAQRGRSGVWRPKNYAAQVICRHADDAVMDMKRYSEAVDESLHFLNEVKPGEVGFADGHLLATKDAIFQTSFRYLARSAQQGQQYFAHVACCPLSDVELIPELLLPGPNPS